MAADIGGLQDFFYFRAAAVAMIPPFLVRYWWWLLSNDNIHDHTQGVKVQDIMELGFDEVPYSWIINIIGFALFTSFVWLNWNWSDPLQRDFKSSDTNTCGSPNCTRCQGLANFQRLKDRCEDFFSNTNTPQTQSQIMSLITVSTSYKSDVLASVYAESGYELEGTDIDMLPHIWMLPGLSRHTFWSGDMHGILNEIIETFENPDNFKSIKDEFEHIYSCSRKGWKTNSVPSGKWQVYHLYNQGTKINENSNQCPFTTHLLSGLPSFMCQHVHGNAMFSVLEPGSSIEPHTGPCNYRLRCHLPLVAPSGYRMRVGTDTTLWEEGKVMVFDDSFVHEVWHQGEEVKECARAVLIFDIWHPDVTPSEQAAIEYIYADSI